MHILFNAWRDVHHPLAGGSEVLVDHLACGLTERGHTVTLRCGRPVSEHSYRVVDAGGRFEQYLTAPFDYLTRHRHNDLVVDVANGMTYFTPLVRRRPTICFVHHVHTEHWAQWFRPPLAALGRNLELHATPRAYRNRLFVAVSPSTATALEQIGVDPAHIRIVHNGVDVPDAVAAQSPEPTFLALGRLVPHKRYDLLAKMWKRVRPLTGGTLVIAGEGPERTKIEAVGAPGMVLTGRISEDEKNRLLGEAWVLLHPASLEGWGLVVLEAAARRVPTIAFDAPGVRDSVVHRATGILAKTEDDFVAAWVEATRNAHWRLHLGEQARMRALTYSWERCADAFEAVAYEATGERRHLRTRSRPRPAHTGRVLHVSPSMDTRSQIDTSIVAVVPSDDLPLRELFASWRSMVDPARTELIIVAEGPERESLALVDGALAGFEQCRPTKVPVDDEAAHVVTDGRVVVLVDAERPQGMATLLAGVADIHEHGRALAGATIDIAPTDGTLLSTPRMFTRCEDPEEAERLVLLVATLGHYNLEAGREEEVLVVELRAGASAVAVS